MSITKPSILMVDDEPNILAGYRRVLASRFDIVTAEGGQNGLGVMRNPGRFKVIVSDMRMPGMDGIQFLQRAHALDPGAILLMLSGNADQETAVRAVNEGAVFRFLNKPCPPEMLERALCDAVRHHELVTAEKAIIRDTLSGAVRLLLDALAFTDPFASASLARIRATVETLCAHLHLDDARYTLAGSLCFIGRVVMPQCRDIITMSEDQLAECATRGAALLRNIPRLGPLAEMIAGQRETTPVHPGVRLNAIPPILLGARLLRLAVDLERAMIRAGGESARAVEILSEGSTAYEPLLLEAARAVFAPRAATGQPTAPEPALVAQFVPIHALPPGAICAEDIISTEGKLQLARGYILNSVAIDRLAAMAASGSIPGRVNVLVAVEPAPEAAASEASVATTLSKTPPPDALPATFSAAA